MTRNEVINKLNKWIKICEKENLIRLENTIIKYKSMSFNSLASFISIPCNKIYRYEQHIVKMQRGACEIKGSTLYARANCLTE